MKDDRKVEEILNRIPPDMLDEAEDLLEKKPVNKKRVPANIWIGAAAAAVVALVVTAGSIKIIKSGKNSDGGEAYVAATTAATTETEIVADVQTEAEPTIEALETTAKDKEAEPSKASVETDVVETTAVTQSAGEVQPTGAAQPTDAAQPTGAAQPTDAAQPTEAVADLNIPVTYDERYRTAGNGSYIAEITESGAVDVTYAKLAAEDGTIENTDAQRYTIECQAKAIFISNNNLIALQTDGTIYIYELKAKAASRISEISSTLDNQVEMNRTAFLTFLLNAQGVEKLFVSDSAYSCAIITENGLDGYNLSSSLFADADFENVSVSYDSYAVLFLQAAGDGTYNAVADDYDTVYANAVDIAGGRFILTADGHVKNYGRTFAETSDWTGIVKISGEANLTEGAVVGITVEGKVRVAGDVSDKVKSMIETIKAPQTIYVCRGYIYIKTADGQWMKFGW